MEPPLHPSDELHCPHCRRWHPLIKPYDEGTAVTQGMLFFVCRGGRYYGGQVEGASRFQTRARADREGDARQESPRMSVP